MNNHERADNLISEAEWNMEQMERAFSESNWNRTIRQAQEAVERYLKAILKEMNVEFPKEHHIAPYLLRILMEKGMAPNDQFAREIERASEGLARKRAPSFYGDEFYTGEQAAAARADAQMVCGFAREILRRLRPGSDRSCPSTP